MGVLPSRGGFGRRATWPAALRATCPTHACESLPLSLPSTPPPPPPVQDFLWTPHVDEFRPDHPHYERTLRWVGVEVCVLF